MATIQHERMEKAMFEPLFLSRLTDALYERMRGQMRKKDIALLDVLVILFCYQVRAARSRGKVLPSMNRSIAEMIREKSV